MIRCSQKPYLADGYRPWPAHITISSQSSNEEIHFLGIQSLTIGH